MPNEPVSKDTKSTTHVYQPGALFSDNLTWQELKDIAEAQAKTIPPLRTVAKAAKQWLDAERLRETAHEVIGDKSPWAYQQDAILRANAARNALIDALSALSTFDAKEPYRGDGDVQDDEALALLGKLYNEALASIRHLRNENNNWRMGKFKPLVAYLDEVARLKDEVKRLKGDVERLERNQSQGATERGK